MRPTSGEWLGDARDLFDAQRDEDGAPLPLAPVDHRPALVDVLGVPERLGEHGDRFPHSPLLGDAQAPSGNSRDAQRRALAVLVNRGRRGLGKALAADYARREYLWTEAHLDALTDIATQERGTEPPAVLTAEYDGVPLFVPLGRYGAHRLGVDLGSDLLEAMGTGERPARKGRRTPANSAKPPRLKADPPRAVSTEFLGGVREARD